MRKLAKLLAVITLSVSINSLSNLSVHAATITFPVLGGSSYSNDFNASRANGCHCATDIMAGKHQPVVSATDGTIYYVEYPQRGTQGYMVIVRSAGGNYYYYIHLNNDTRGTDDGKGGGMKAYAPDIRAGNPVKKGQLLGWVGDSGNAENTGSHLHFEVRRDSPDGEPSNPYNALKKARRVSKPVEYTLPNELLPFNSWYDSKLNIARGDLTNDGTDELIVGNGFGNKPKVRVFNQRNQQIDGFYPSTTSAQYGADVATGDVDGDGINEIVVGYRSQSSPRVAIFRRSSASPLNFVKASDFKAFEGNTSPRVAVGDVNNDGKDEIIAAKGRGSSPAVRIFNSEGETINTSFVVSRDFRGGLDVAAADVAGDGRHEIIVSQLTDGSSFVRVFDQDFNKVSGKGFYAYDKHYGGVYISAGNVMNQTQKAEIVTVPNGSYPEVKYFNSSGYKLGSSHFIEEWWEKGYYDIAAGDEDYSAAVGGNRRGSIR